jgi:hypothetical protein
MGKRCQPYENQPNDFPAKRIQKELQPSKSKAKFHCGNKCGGVLKPIECTPMICGEEDMSNKQSP